MDSSGMTVLSKMLRTLECTVREGDYVYAVVDQARLAQLPIAAAVQEVGGWTVVLERAEADRAGLSYDFVAAWITLTVHSSLQAVGLTACFSKALVEPDRFPRAGLFRFRVAATRHKRRLRCLRDAPLRT